MQVVWNIAITASILMLAGVSFALPFRVTRAFDFSHGILFIIAPFTVWTATNTFGLPPIVGIAAALATTCITGLCLGYLCFRAIRGGILGWQVSIASLGGYVILQNCVSVFWGDELHFLWNNNIVEGLNLLGARVTSWQLIMMGVATGALLIMFALLQFTTLGKKIAAVASNRELCVIVGISPVSAHIFAVTCASILAGICGILVAVDTGFTPASGFRLLLGAFAVVVIGGIGGNIELLFGALLIAAVQHLTAYMIDTRWTDAATFIILICFLISKPLGFSGKRLRKIEI